MRAIGSLGWVSAFQQPHREGGRVYGFFVASLAVEELHRLEIKDDKVLAEEVIFKGLGRIRHVITGPDGALVRSAAGVREGDLLKLRFADGEMAATAGVRAPPPPPSKGGAGKAAPPEEPPPRPRIRRRSRTEDQGDLF